MKRIWPYHAVVFLSAFLLFQVQPMVSKALLPRFGGSYLVWGACMVFCQAMLLLGYVYAHAVQLRVGVARYGRWHLLVLLLPLLCFPFRFDSIVAGDLPLVVSVFALLLVMIGLPFVVLATTSLLLQRWLSVSDLPQRDNPYVLYAASNLGSMLALLTYPVIVEPFFSLREQGVAWWTGYIIMVVLHLFCLPRRTAGDAQEWAQADASRTPKPGARQLGTWLLLSAAACAVLLAVTNVITFDVASAPFLWVLPLAVYLLCFVLAFKRRLWCPSVMRRILPWSVLVGILVYVLAQFRLTVPPVVLIGLHLVICFVVCLNCSARLIETRPQSHESLTVFYLCLAAGGLLGSVVVSWIMPLVSSSLTEYPLSLCLAAMGLLVAGGSGGQRESVRSMVVAGVLAVLAVTLVPWLGGRVTGMTPAVNMAITALPVALILLWGAKRPQAWVVVLLVLSVAMNWTEDLAAGVDRATKHRNYYGIYKVFDKDGVRYLQHGTTQHGRQVLDEAGSSVPQAYFHPSTPAAGVLRNWQARAKDIGMIGLGSGALAMYAGDGQRFTVYELDPDNLDIAAKNFTYLKLAEANGAQLDFVFGDGRVNLRGRADASLDVMILDAFNSGSIPVHLITVEAIEEYLRVVRTEGVVLMHISNKVLDLYPVVYSNARELKVPLCEKNNEGVVVPGAELTYWVALSRNEEVIDRLCREQGWWRRKWSDAALPRPWTDQYSNLFGAMVKK